MPDLSLSYDFQHSPERMHTIMSEVENHDRFMPFCREGRIVSAQPGRRKFNVGYVLSSKKYGFTREFSAAFELKPETLNRRHPLPGAGCGRPRCCVRIAFGPGGAGASRATVEIAYGTPRGALRLVPLKPLIGRGFRKVWRPWPRGRTTSRRWANRRQVPASAPSQGSFASRVS